MKVTLCCMTYNHVNFVEQAIESFVNQHVNFDYEIVIADDCSTDGTTDIVLKYANKFPHLIKPIIRKSNIGAMNNYLDLLSSVKSKYVAYCECDDYFSDPYKLQKQVDFLEQHPECSICFHKTKIFYEDDSQKEVIAPSPRDRFEKTILDMDDLLKINFIPSNSVVYRWRFVEENIYDVFPKDIMPADYYLHFLHAEKGRIGFLDETMSCYRKHKGGTWYDNETVMKKHGIKYFCFLFIVWETFAKSSKDFFEKQLAPFLYSFCRFALDGKVLRYYPETKVRKIRQKRRILIILAIIEFIIILSLLFAQGIQLN